MFPSLLASLDAIPEANVRGEAPFAPCPRVHLSDAEAEASFWADFDANPKPMILTSDHTVAIDYLKTHGRKLSEEAYRLPDGSIVGSASGSPYVLTDPAYAPGLFADGLLSKYPLPGVLASIAQRPVISIGRNRTGEKDIAHHFHPVTGMRLLQGRKIWALRPPTDPECRINHGTCTDPFLVCDYYEAPSAPMPACVQEAGETILVPDGWYHGTCNNASWTVGVGFQGRSMGLAPPRCFHCRAGGPQMQYATTTESVLTSYDAAALIMDLEELARNAGAGRGRSMRSGSAEAQVSGAGEAWDGIDLTRLQSGQAPHMAFRSLCGQFVWIKDLADRAANSALRDPRCTLHSAASLSRQLANLQREGYVHILLTLRGPAPTLSLMHRSSGEVEDRMVPLHRAAVWVNSALSRLQVATQAGNEAASGGAFVVCAAPLPWLSTTRTYAS